MAQITKTTRPDGTVEYRNEHGELHRIDGPAIEHSSGTKSWWLYGLPHRIDGPAVEHSSGTKTWYFNGRVHRTDGPAVIHSDGSQEWFIDGKQLTEEQFYEHELCTAKIQKVDNSKDEVMNEKPVPINYVLREYEDRHVWYAGKIPPDKLTLWKRDGKLHREDGPAVEHPCGKEEWYFDGQRHRVDGPAIEWPDGSGSWWVNGQRHRTDGPADEYEDGTKSWWIKGEHLTQEEFYAHPLCTVSEEHKTETKPQCSSEQKPNQRYGWGGLLSAINRLFSN